MKRIIPLLLMYLAAPFVFAAEPFVFTEEETQQPATLIWRGDAQLRADAINGIDVNPLHDDFRRGLFRLRAGFDWLPSDSFQLAVLARINRSSRANEDSRFDYDNELADDETIDELFIRFTPDTGTALTLGQAPLPLNLSPALWDDDLRPIGGFIAQDVEIGMFSRLRFQLARFNPNHPFFDEPDFASSDDTTRASAVQAAADFGLGRQYNWHVTATYIEFEDLDPLAAEHIARSNRFTGGFAPGATFVNDFTVADLQLNLRRNQGMPLEFGIDVFRNLDAPQRDDGGRVSVRLGDALRAGGYEFGVASQRIQRDATVAAFNDDDWWFPTWMRGTRVWLGYGVSEDFRIQFAAFRERRDDWDDHVTRGILDFRYTF